jgi:radical SAM superfamily enzyme YgiQ (UPF0313 family)
MSIGKSDILFVFPPAPGNIGAFRNHLGVAYLRAALAREGMATAQYLSENPGTVDAVAEDIIRQQCPIAGFTVYDANAPLSIAIAQCIKQRKPGTRVVFGGPTVTFNARSLMERHPAIDACVMGEAEETAAQIFTKLLDGRDLDDTQPGVAFRRNEEVVRTTLPPLVGSREPGVQGVLDSTPSPYLSGILADGHEGVLTGRGCTHHCQYCCFAAIARRHLRLHSIERVLAELEYIAGHQRRSGEHYPVTILDDAFTLLPPRAKVLCQAIADRKLNLTLSCITRADTLDEELIRLMREAGFVSVSFGLESAVPSVLRAIGKVRSPDWHDRDLAPERQFIERVRSSVLLAKKYGFKVSVSIILGLPTETPADGVETLRFVKALPVDSYAHNFLNVFVGTPLWTTHEQYGIRCCLDKIGLPATTGYAYDTKMLKPGPKCNKEETAGLIRLLAADALYSCEGLLPGKGTGVVILERRELSPEIAEWLRAILTVGGTVVQVYPAMKESERGSRLYRDRSILSEHLVPFEYHIQVQPKKTIKDNEDESWEVASANVDVYRKHRKQLLSIRASRGATPLIAWANSQGANATVCEISEYLSRPSDLVRLMNRIEKENAVSYLRRMPIPPHVKYSARWLSGKAPCFSLSRIEIDGYGKIRCCRHGQPIGKVGDSPKVLSKRLAQLASAVERRRGCAECRNALCPRCPFPGIEDRAYCRVMTQSGPAHRLLEWIRLYSQLPLLVALKGND